MNQRAVKSLVVFVSLWYGMSTAKALTFPLPPAGEDIVGELQMTKVQQGESLGEIGRRFDVGVYEMLEANPHIKNPWAPKKGTSILIPTQFILPRLPRKGLIINLAEMRVYYFHTNSSQVSTYPIGIGRNGWNTPLGKGVITQKNKNPSWYPPESIRQEHLKKGDPLPEIVPPGPDNPLGNYAMRLSIPGYLVHGTNRPGGIGVRSTHGCIRLLPKDIEALYQQAAIGTPVHIIHAQYKFGHSNNRLYLEAHEPLSDPYYHPKEERLVFKQAFLEATIEQYLGMIDWVSAQHWLERSKGYPILLE